jgi:sterol O-acyltransferase
MNRKKHVFFYQESPFTLALESNTGKWFFSAFLVSTLPLLTLQLFLWITNYENCWTYDYSIISSAFSGIQTVLKLLFLYYFILLSMVYPITLRFGSKYPSQVKCLMIVSSVFCLINSAVTSHKLLEMGAASRIGLYIETIRMIMKLISFVFEVLDLLKQKKKDNLQDDIQKNINSPTFLSFVYFLFCPTMIYAPSYPKTTSRNWTRLLMNFYIWLIIIYLTLKVVPFVFLPLSKFGIDPISEIILIQQTVIFFSYFTHHYFLIMCGLGFFHAWLNMWSEFLMFGDRRFYADYYCQHNVADGFRKWNFPVQNWLYRYVYLSTSEARVLDKSDNRVVRSKWSAEITLIFSFIFHDYCAFIVCGWISPAYTIIMTGLIMSGRHLKPKERNLQTPDLYKFCVFFCCDGVQGLLHLVYTLEFYAKRNCPSEVSTVLDLFYPRLLSCQNSVAR